MEFGAARRSVIKRRIKRQPQVGTGSFQVFRDGESSADNRVAIKPPGCPGKTEARLEVLAAIYALIQPSASAILTGRLKGPGLGVNVSLLVFLLPPRPPPFPPQPNPHP